MDFRTNHLIHEKSPYLLQHAHNPVDWYPWGEEAFEAAKRLDKPIFLSIGYATCHWCHVMAKESFENEKIGGLLNHTFINVKVDKEERPEVDALYMDFAQSLMAGSAGWPLNLILTPDLKPFFAATYLPPYSQEGMMGLSELIERIKEIWEGEERDKIEEQASRLVSIFEQHVQTKGEELPSKEQVERAVELYFKIADPVYGGLRGAPKFPVGYQCNFLLNHFAKHQDSRALFLAEKTLQMISGGGIHDQIGGGFSRYSVDEKWIIPHFEKMLCDNAMLADAYCDAWRITKTERFKQVAIKTLDYLLRDLRHPLGGFFSAEDADSEEGEGSFYLWTKQEFTDVVGLSDAPLLAEYYGVTEMGNFEGKNVLHTPLSDQEFAVAHGLEPALFEKKKESALMSLSVARSRRKHPAKDDKVLTCWNGLAIHALAKAGAVFQLSRFTEAAKQCVEFIKKYSYVSGRLYRGWRTGEAFHLGGLEDYAFFIRGLITLYEVGEGVEYLEWALTLALQTEELFKSPEGAFFQCGEEESSLLIRKCLLADGAEPSGNAVHAENLLRLYRITLEEKWKTQAEDIFRAVKKYFDSFAPGYFYHAMNLNDYFDVNAPTLVIVPNKEGEHLDRIKKALFEKFICHATYVWIQPDQEKLGDYLPALSTYKLVDGRTTFYYCKEGGCRPPLNDLVKIVETLDKL